jgi:hypothetical protein
VTDASGFATTTLGPTYWGERLGTRLTTLRLHRQPRTPIAEARSGAVHVRGTVRAITAPVRGPVTGRRIVLGRLLSCVAPVALGKRNSGRAITLADVTFGGDFVIEDESGRARVAVGVGVPFELLVLVRRAGEWNASSRSDSLRVFAEANPDARVPLHVSGAVHGEWAIEEGQTLSVIASVVGEGILEDGRELSVIATVRTEEASSEDRDYRGLVRARGLASSVGHPICFFE